MNRILKLKNKENISLPIEYHIVRSHRKTCSITIQEDGVLMLRVPLSFTEQEAEALLHKKRLWITGKLEILRKRQAAITSSSLTEAQRTSLELRYVKAAKEYIPKRAAYYHSAYPELFKQDYSRIQIRDQKIRWGSCSSKGTLSFNWRLMLAPPGILDYVVVHELCHLVHMNHSKEFWNCVASILPDYRAKRKWLKEHGNELTLS